VSLIRTVLDTEYEVIESVTQVLDAIADRDLDESLVLLDLLDPDDDEAGQIALHPDHIVSIEAD
jgi:hypothetical protein